MNQSFYMHSRYDESKEFLNTVNSDAIINPNSLNLAFEVWLKMVKSNDKLRARNAMLVQALNEVSE
jgi:hypothetical protein